MTKEIIIRKLTSRKFWMALIGLVSGLILAFGGSATTAETVSGVMLQLASVVGYVLAEGLTDAAATEAHKEG
jgi:drug/metabolite transporter (DMT)-like permease